MRTNKIHNLDLFTEQANELYTKHLKTLSKKYLLMLKEAIDWKALLKPIESELARNRRKEDTGRKPFDLMVIVKCFILQYMYGLSDPRLEEEVADRRSFQIFLELNTGDSIPDETTICRYRERFARLGLDKILFKSFNNQLRKKNLILECGTIVDATIKQAQAKPSSNRDKDAEHTRKGGEYYYGYKGTIGQDMATDVIHSVDFSPAGAHDTKHFEEVLHGKEKKVYADKGYWSEGRKNNLEENGIECNILKKGVKNRPLTKEEKGKNRQLSGIRNAVERPFAYMKRVLSYDRVRYYDLSRNRFEFTLCAMLYNMRRLITHVYA